MNFDQIKEDLDLFSEGEDRYGYIIGEYHDENN